MVRPLIERGLSRGIRALLSTAPWAVARLEPFAGSKITLDMGEWQFHFKLDSDGYPVLQHEVPSELMPDLRIRMSPGVLPKLAMDPEVALRELHLEGNSGLAAQVGYLGTHFRPDLEELASRLVGDVIAHRLGMAFRKGRAWTKDATARFSDACSEYVTEEARLVASGSSLRRFSREVNQLAQDIRQLESRMTGII